MMAVYRGSLSLTECAIRLGLGESTTCRKSHASERHDALSG
jgi:hypothetical protein